MERAEKRRTARAVPIGRSIGFRIYSWALAFAAVLVIAAGLAVLAVETRSVRLALDAGIEQVRVRVSEVLLEPLWSYSKSQIETVIRLEMQSREILYIYVLDENGQPVAGLARDRNGAVTPREAADNDFILKSLYTTVQSHLTRNDFPIGLVDIGFTDVFARREIARRFLADVGRMTVVIALVLGFALAILKATAFDPLSRMVETVRRFGGRDYAARIPPRKRRDELSELADAFNTMAALIESHSVELERLVDERTKQLVESEKLAFLGSLVAGVAHEINTPVGVAVTAASHLTERTANLRRDFEADDLTRSDLASYLAEADEAASIMLANLRRAGDFVRSFKQVAIDQSHEERRLFKLKPYVEEIIFSLKPRLKKTRHVVDVDIPDGLTLNTMPGLLSQIVTNLVVNSLDHGFETDQAGRIGISARVSDGKLVFVYRDNGKGVPREIQHRIFQPFFTTRRDRGGTGLGLYIIANIATKLSGSVAFASEPGAGVEFTVTLPPETVASQGADT